MEMCIRDSVHSGNVAPIALHPVRINPLQILIPDEDVIDKIISVFLGAALHQFNELPAADNVNPC